MKVIVGAFKDEENARDAVEDLRSEGYDPKDISVVMKEKSEKVAAVNAGSTVDVTMSGITAGGAVGALAGLLIGIGAIAIPGIGGLLIGGPLAVALGLTGAAATTVTGAATGALAGGLVGALVGLGIPEEEAKIYEERIKEGGIIIAVPYLEDKTTAEDALRQNSADEIRIINLNR